MGLITYENLEDGTPVTANVFNERFAQIVAQMNGNIDDSNIADDGISKEKLKAEVYESLYPVGSMYVNFTDDTDPAVLLGFGVWSAVEGRVVVGYDGTQTEFNAAEKTGGAKTHTLTATEQASMDVHKGGQSNANTDYIDLGTGGGLGGWVISIAATNVGQDRMTAQGGGQPHNNLQPYIVGYVWKRVS